jgi:hypothetical protein
LWWDEEGRSSIKIIVLKYIENTKTVTRASTGYGLESGEEQGTEETYSRSPCWPTTEKLGIEQRKTNAPDKKKEVAVTSLMEYLII